MSTYEAFKEKRVAQVEKKVNPNPKFWELVKKAEDEIESFSKIVSVDINFSTDNTGQKNLKGQIGIKYDGCVNVDRIAVTDRFMNAITEVIKKYFEVEPHWDTLNSFSISLKYFSKWL